MVCAFVFPTTSTTLSVHEGSTQVTFNNNNDDNTDSNNKSPCYCGSNGVSSSSATDKSPCLILVDVNGDKKPTPANVNNNNNTYTYPSPGDSLLKDIFSIMITDDRAVPFGVVAQKAMYNSTRKTETKEE